MADNKNGSTDTAIRDLASALAMVDDPTAITQLMEEVLTPSERRNVALRWRLMQMLRDGVTQRAIAEKLGISLCKITRGSRILKTPGSIAARLLHSELKEQAQ